MAILRPAGELTFTGPTEIGDIEFVAIYFAIGEDPIQDPDSEQRGMVPIVDATTDEPGMYSVSVEQAFADIFGGIDDIISVAVAFVDDFGNESDLSEVIQFPLDRTAPEAPTSLAFVTP